MLQKKIDKSFIGMPHVFGIADDILIAGFNEQGKNHDETFEKVLWVWRQENLNLNKEKYVFRCTSILFFALR